jgi:hypothetical protein
MGFAEACFSPTHPERECKPVVYRKAEIAAARCTRHSGLASKFMVIHTKTSKDRLRIVDTAGIPD